MTIYRGCDITKNEDGSYGVHSGGSYPVISEAFATEEKAMDAIDAAHRATLAKERA
jgi:hypothetical protein